MIPDREVRLIDENGEHIGILTYREASKLAKERGLDLFIVQPDSVPPVAKMMDRGRYRFEQEQTAREAKRTHHFIDVKEIKMRYTISDHDYQIKLRSAENFIANGDKVKVLIILRGREGQHTDLAVTIMQKFGEQLKASATIERGPTIEGKTITMILSPLNRSASH
ncbi:MAG TPA: translation initiation factor IF-3 [Drouetiella sp.]